MTFDDILAQVLELLQREGRVSYRALKVRFQLDDDLVWPKYPNVLLSHRLRLYHDVCFTLNFIARSPILIIHVSRLGKGERGMDWKKPYST
jgi:hypothetical protein